MRPRFLTLAFLFGLLAGCGGGRTQIDFDSNDPALMPDGGNQVDPDASIDPDDEEDAGPDDEEAGVEEDAGAGGAGGQGGAGGSGGQGGAGGSGGSGGGGVADCFQCVQSECPSAMECLMDQKCRDGATCVFSQCLGGGGPGGVDFQCAIGCFGGDFSTGMKAVQSLQCVMDKCQSCGGLLGGGGGGFPGFPGG